MSRQWQTPQRCETCTDPTKSRIESCGPDTGMKTVVSYVCENEDCDVKESERLIEQIKKEAAKPKEGKKPVVKKSAAKKATSKKK